MSKVILLLLASLYLASAVQVNTKVNSKSIFSRMGGGLFRSKHTPVIQNGVPPTVQIWMDYGVNERLAVQLAIECWPLIKFLRDPDEFVRIYLKNKYVNGERGSQYRSDLLEDGASFFKEFTNACLKNKREGHSMQRLIAHMDLTIFPRDVDSMSKAISVIKEIIPP